MGREAVLEGIGGKGGARPRPAMAPVPNVPHADPYAPVVDKQRAAMMCGTTVGDLQSGIGGKSTMTLAQAVCTMVAETRQQTEELRKTNALLRALLERQG